MQVNTLNTFLNFSINFERFSYANVINNNKMPNWLADRGRLDQTHQSLYSIVWKEAVVIITETEKKKHFFFQIVIDIFSSSVCVCVWFRNGMHIVHTCTTLLKIASYELCRVYLIHSLGKKKKRIGTFCMFLWKNHWRANLTIICFHVAHLLTSNINREMNEKHTPTHRRRIDFDYLSARICCGTVAR